MPKRLIQHRLTGKYYAGRGTWTSDPVAAKDFSQDSLIRIIGAASAAARRLSSLVQQAFSSAAAEPLLGDQAENTACSLPDNLALKGESVGK